MQSTLKPGRGEVPKATKSKNVKQVIKNSIVKSSFLTNYNIPTNFIRGIDIEPIATCNLKCSFCQVPGWSRASETKPMDIELFKKVINQFPNLNHVKLQGMGEPFLNRKLTEMIKIASDHNINTTIVTNGTLLNPKLNHKVLEAGLTNLSFSFDGATKETFENAREGVNYDKVISNIEAICKLKKELKAKTKITMVCLVSNEDILMEIPALVKLASKLGVDHLSIKKRLKIWKKVEKEGIYELESVYLEDNSDYIKIMEQAITIAQELGLNLGMGGDPDYSSSNPCLWPWQSMYVSTEGKVVPCCVLADPGTWTLGDLTKYNLKDIWNNKAYKDLRKQLRKNQIPGTCKSCYRD